MDSASGKSSARENAIEGRLGPGLARLDSEVAPERLGSRWAGVVLEERPMTRQHFGITVLEHLTVRGTS